MARILLVAVFAFAFVSADAAAALGLERARILLYLLVYGALIAVAVLRRPLPAVGFRTVPILLLTLLLLMLALSAGHPVDPIDYKVALPVIGLLAAPSLARALASNDLGRLVWTLLALYVTATALGSLAGVAPVDVKGHDDLLRYDFSGSVVSHSGLCSVFLLVTLARLPSLASDPARALNLALAALALVMILLSATRTTLVTFALFLLLHAATSADPLAALRRAFAPSLLLLAAFLLYTMLVSDAFLARLLGDGVADYSSGRWSSQLYWLLRGAEHPLGLGLGAVRAMLRDGRPPLNDGGLLEWPHDEPVRFYVEGGLLGLAFVVLLTGFLLRRGLRAARLDRDQTRRALILAILADMVAECLLQNYLNDIYHAASLLIVLATMIASVEAAAVPACASAIYGGKPRPTLRHGQELETKGGI